MNRPNRPETSQELESPPEPPETQFRFGSSKLEPSNRRFRPEIGSRSGLSETVQVSKQSRAFNLEKIKQSDFQNS